MADPSVSEYLALLGACDGEGQALPWVRECEARGLGREEILAACERADWLLWLAGRLRVDARLIVECAVRIAETVQHHVPASERRPVDALALVRRWLAGEPVSAADLWAAAWAAADAADAAASAASAARAAARAADAAARAADAADAAARAARAAWAAARAADAAARAARAAADAAASAAHAAIVREVIPWPTWRAAIAADLSAREVLS